MPRGELVVLRCSFREKKVREKKYFLLKHNFFFVFTQFIKAFISIQKNICFLLAIKGPINSYSSELWWKYQQRKGQKLSLEHKSMFSNVVILIKFK